MNAQGLLMKSKSMYKNIVIFIVLLLLAGCSATQKTALKPSQKAFEQEDFIILLALRAEQVNEYNASSSMYNTLYEKSGKKEYLYRSLQNDLQSKNDEKVIKRVDEITEGSFSDYKLIRLKILALSRLGRLEEAKTTAIMLVELSDESNDYLIVSNVYIRLGKYNTALKYLESAYAKDFNEKILDTISVLLYVNLDRKKDAIAQLESHTLMHGCSKTICTRLISFYSEQNNIDGLLSIYIKMYAQHKDVKIANQIVQIYGYKKDYAKLMDFLQENQIDNKLLLQLYIQEKKYKEAYLVADKLYEETRQIKFLGQSAIFEYEGASDKNDNKMHESVLKKLMKVISEEQNPLYYNYLGYLLIDHEIDIKKGMKYIKTALGYNPGSEYYLDSLAWGYYKLGNCAKARKIMNKIMKIEGASSEAEVIQHNKMIQMCKPKKKKGKKK